MASAASDDECNSGDEQSNTQPEPLLSPQDLEKREEAKLIAKYPAFRNRNITGQSAFLQKRLSKGQKYFDSGDYQMAKQMAKAKATNKNSLTLALPSFVPSTGDAIPTPETVPARKTSIIQSKFPSTPSSNAS